MYVHGLPVTIVTEISVLRNELAASKGAIAEMQSYLVNVRGNVTLLLSQVHMTSNSQLRIVVVDT